MLSETRWRGFVFVRRLIWRMSLVGLSALVLTSDIFIDEAEARSRRKVRGGGYLHSMKRDPIAARGSCLAAVRSGREAREILARTGVRTPVRTRSAQLISIAVGVQQVELLGNVRLVRGVNVTFPRHRRYSRYLSGPATVQMGRNHRDGNVAHVMHEIGHHVGNQGLYGPYKRRVSKCPISRYSHKVWARGSARNEEFAEVFAAFVTNPSRLTRSRSRGCREAYHFFASYFPRADEFAICDRRALQRAIERRGGGRLAFLEPEIGFSVSQITSEKQ